jgi:hypothetical protein
VERARERFGWYLDRGAYGPDLYAEGRSAVLAGRSAQEQLERCWALVRPAALSLASPGEVLAVDDRVAGRTALPSERAGGGAQVAPRVRATRPAAPSSSAEGEPFGAALLERRLGGLLLTPRVVTWSLVVLDVSDEDDESKSFHLAIPGARLAGTLHRLDRGELDATLRQLLASRDRLGTLSSSDQVTQVDAFGSISAAGRLVPRERDPLTGRVGGPGGPGSRRDKERQQDPARRPPRPPRQLLLAGAAIAAVIVAIVAVIALSGDDADDLAATGGVVPTSPGTGEPTGTDPDVEVPDGEGLEALNGTYGITYSEPRVLAAEGAWANVVFNYDCFADSPDLVLPGQDQPRPFRMSSEDGEGGCVGTEGPTWPEQGGAVTVECVQSSCDVSSAENGILFTLDGSLEELDALGLPDRDPCTDEESAEPRSATVSDGVPTVITSTFLVNSGYSEDGFVGCDGGRVEVERDVTLTRGVVFGVGGGWPLDRPDSL